MRISDWSSDVCSSDLVTAIGFVTDRAERALAIEANHLLGGDAVVRGDQPIAGLLREAASAPWLAHTETVEFSSMIRVGEEIGRASCRERVCPDVLISVVAVSLKNKLTLITLYD